MIDELIARIKATVPALKAVGTAANFQVAVENNPAVTPCCFVITLDEQPGPNKLADCVVQQHVNLTVGIILVVRNLKDARGEAAGVDMETLRKLVKDQVFGWQVSSEFDPFERGGSHLLTFKDGHMWWQDLYITAYEDRSIQ